MDAFFYLAEWFLHDRGKEESVENENTRRKRMKIGMYL